MEKLAGALSHHHWAIHCAQSLLQRAYKVTVKGRWLQFWSTVLSLKRSVPEPHNLLLTHSHICQHLGPIISGGNDMVLCTTWSPHRLLVIPVIQWVDVTVIGQRLSGEGHFPLKMMGGNVRALALAPGSAIDSVQPRANHFRTAPKPVLWLPEKAKLVIAW